MAEEELTPSPRPAHWRDLARALLERELVLDATAEDSGDAPGPGEEPAVHPAWAAAQAAVRRAEAAFEAATSDSDDPLCAVMSSAELDTDSARLLALCVGLDGDRAAQRVLAALQGDPGATRLELDTLARVLGHEAVDCLADDARLLSAGLLELDASASFAATTVVVPRRVAWALRDDLSLDPELPVGTELVVLPPTMPGMQELALVHGADRVRRQQAAMSALAPLAFLLTTPPADDHGWRVLVRQATLGGLGVVLELTEGVDPLAQQWLERADHLAWGLCSKHPLDLATVPRRDLVEVTAGDPEVSEQEWQSVFPDAPVPARRPTAAQLLAAQVAPVTDPAEAVRRVATGTLLSHATRVVPRVTWDELVLPPGQEAQLRSLVDRYLHRSTVHDEWGLSLYPSPGVVALFSGPSGTGKTTSAEVIAHELGVDMFRVDLSALVSKYIGETEKNLEEIFSAAHTGNYLLLFDEADSLFGSRSKVEDAKDRYANLEVSYLLQRLETYDGLVVLTSNFQGNIDQAFLRRIHVTVHFTVPSEEERLRIWQRSLGRAPLGDVDLGLVARVFDLTGGSIRNAALGAAFAAAASRGRIEMPDLLRAVTQEMTKLGRRVTDTQLGPWGAALRETPPAGGGARSV